MPTLFEHDAAGGYDNAMRILRKHQVNAATQVHALDACLALAGGAGHPAHQASRRVQEREAPNVPTW